MANPKVRPRALACLGKLRLGCVHGDGVYLYNEQVSERYRLGDCDEKESKVYCTIIQSQAIPETVLCFVGYRSSKRNQTLRVWRYFDGKVEPIDLNVFVSATQLHGFGYACQGTDTESHLTYLASGLGLGIARLWTLDNRNGRVKLLGIFKAKHPIIASFLILPADRKFIVGSSFDMCVQEWNFNAFADPPEEYSGKSARQMSKREIRELNAPEFCEDLEINPQQVLPPVEFVLANEEWRITFPPKTVDPTIYEGEVNNQGIPHGKGSRLLPDGYLFDGQWRDGLPIHGKVKGANGHEYEGEVQGENAVAHGLGRETRKVGSNEVEIYHGGWRDGERHGIYSLSWQNTNSQRSRFHGVREFGFYQEGVPHGLAIHEWNADSPEFPFAMDVEAEARALGTIRCTQLKRKGQVLDEFHFHRADGKPLSKHERTLLNVKDTNKGPETFAEPPSEGRRCGRSNRTECWACLEDCETSDNVIQCVGCSMRIHEACAWPPGFFQSNHVRDFGWLCMLCQEKQLGHSNKVFVMYDHHGEPVVIDSKQEALEQIPRNSKGRESPIIIYAVDPKVQPVSDESI